MLKICTETVLIRSTIEEIRSLEEQLKFRPLGMLFVCLFAVRGGQFLRDPVNSNVSKRTDRMDFTYSLDLHFHASHIDANHIGASTYENHIRAFRRPEG